MKVIKVTEVSIPPVMGSPVGAYLCGSVLWMVPFPGACPMTYADNGMVVDVDESSRGQAGGVSEATLLKAIAISQRPELATTLAE